MVLITYTPGPAARAELYEPWLREEDNPTFNRVPGVGEYSNWKLADPAALDCSHFDFLDLGGPEDLERVWFSSELDRFRARWVERWGYRGARPDPVSGYATLFVRDGPPMRAEARYAVLDFEPAAVPPGREWTAIAALRKHWALGRAPQGEPWRWPIAQMNPLRCASLEVRFHDAPAPPGPGRRVVAECIASPFIRKESA